MLHGAGQKQPADGKRALPAMSLPYTQNALPTQADVVVIGGGIIGTSTAFYTSQAGLDTVVLEMRNSLGSLASAASAGTFRALFDEPEVVALARASIEIYARFADEVGLPGLDIGFRQQGYLFASCEPDGYEVLEARAAHKRRIGLQDVELLDGDEARHRFSYLAPQVTAALYRAADGWLSPHQVVHGFAAGSRARFALDTQATGITLDGRGVCAVETNRGAIGTRAVVVAAGAFAPLVAAGVGLDLPVDVVRLQQVIIRPRPLIPQEAPVTVDWTTGCYWRPEVGGGLLGWADPLVPNEDPAVEVPVDWEFPALVLERAEGTTPFWHRVAANLKVNQVSACAGQVSYPYDNKPVLGAVPEFDGLFLNAGHSYGIMVAPASGYYLAQVVLGERLAAENPFSYERLVTHE
jgi:glycine/D-amino acid oxidase-like deaminating enzyme